MHEKVLQMVESYHKNYPLRRGIPREELKSRLKLSPRAFNALITNYLITQYLEGLLTISSRKPEHEIRFDSGQQAKVQALMRKFEQNPFSPPSVKECRQEVG